MRVVKGAGGTGDDYGKGVAAFPDGSLAVTGYFNGTAFFAPGESNERQFTSAGGTDIFLAKFFPYGD